MILKKDGTNRRQIWRVWEVPRLPRKFPELPRKFFGDFPGGSLTVEQNSKTAIQGFPGLPRKFPKLPRKFPDFPGGQLLSLGSLTPSPDSQKLSLNKEHALASCGRQQRGHTCGSACCRFASGGPLACQGLRSGKRCIRAVHVSHCRNGRKRGEMNELNELSRAHKNKTIAWGPPQFQERRSRSERAILGALGEFRGILGATLGVQK